MLNKSLAAHRIYDLHELSDFGDKNVEYQLYKDIAYAVSDMIQKKFIPQKREMEYDRLSFEYDLAIESAMMVFAQEAWWQGLKDGIELSKVLN